jgi:hypothetical protein
MQTQCQQHNETKLNGIALPHPQFFAKSANPAKNACNYAQRGLYSILETKVLAVHRRQAGRVAALPALHMWSGHIHNCIRNTT